jgi:chaperonin GroES
MPTINNPAITMNSTPALLGRTPGVVTKLSLAQLVQSRNIAELLTSQELLDLGSRAVDNYVRDLGTRKEWELRMAAAIKLALQVQEIKNFPWDNCSNIKFPLLTIACLQFLARISVMTKGRNLVKVEPIGRDVDGSKFLQAQRISMHLSLQMIEDDVNWIDNDEQAKLAASIMGSAFKKTHYDSVRGIVNSEHVPAKNLVMDYFTTDIDRSPCLTHQMSVNGNVIQERIRRGLYCEMVDPVAGGPSVTNVLSQVSDDSAGLRRPMNDSGSDFVLLEQHCWMDLDSDGYAEPYIVIVREDTKQILRIVAKYFDEGDVFRVNDPQVRDLSQQLQAKEAEDDSKMTEEQKAQQMKERSALEKEIHRLETEAGNKIVRIDPVLYFTRILFIPSPDGGVYGLGLGALLGPMNEAVSTLINQLIDSGTMQNTAGGFLGRGVKIKGGRMNFDPFEWKPIDSSGDDLRKNIFPLPVRESSAVLFNLLGMLVSYSERLSGATDIMTGVSPGQNTPAETSRNTVEQGMMLFSGIYKRMYRGQREETKKFAVLNRLYLTTSPRFFELTQGPNAIIAPDDYLKNDFRIFPSASPEAVSETQIKEKAKHLLELANSPAGAGLNKYLITKNFLEVWGYENVEQIYPDPKGPNAIAPPPNPKVELEKAKLQQAAKEHDDEMQIAVVELKAAVELNAAKILELQAKAQNYLAQADGVDRGHEIALLDAQIGAAKVQQEGLHKAVSLMQKSIELKQKAKALGVPHGDTGQRQAGVGLPPSDAGVPAAAPQ